MTKESTLSRWALLDKSGKTRGTCEAITKGFANTLFRRKTCKTPGQIRAKLPAGWTIVDRGPVESKPAPRRWKLEDFHVGDTIRLKADHWAVKHEGVPEGTTTKLVEREQGGHFRTDLKPCADKEYAMRFTPIEYTEAQVEKVEPAPQPKDEKSPRGEWADKLAAKDAEIATLKADLEEVRRNSRGMLDAFCDALDMPGEFWGELVAAAKFNKAQVKTLKSEVEEARDVARSMSAQAHNAIEERNAAEAKLADIAAIMRVNDMVSAIPEDAEPWHFHGLVQTVLDR